jgi:hypothetical protein
MFYLGDTTVKKALVNINVRVPLAMRELLETYVQHDLHTNISEFTRDAIREKIHRDVPQLFTRLFKELNS